MAIYATIIQVFTNTKLVRLVFKDQRTEKNEPVEVADIVLLRADGEALAKLLQDALQVNEKGPGNEIPS